MKSARAASVVFSFILFTLAFVLPALSAQKAAAQSNAGAPVPALTASLADLQRVSEATESDISNLRTENRKNSWKTVWMFWHRSGPQNQEAERAAASLQKNLHDAMPGLIHDAQTSGSFTATFKLYHNLSLVCELLDSLVDATKSGGKADGPLVYDSSAMGRIRQDLATYVEQSAAALDSKGNPYAMSAGPGGKPRKIVIDDTIPEKKHPRKKAVAPQQ
jgi:hypothetical protein